MQTDGRTDGETRMTKLILAFCGFSNPGNMSMTKIVASRYVCFAISINSGEVLYRLCS
jgi:hypothetical protein